MKNHSYISIDVHKSDEVRFLTSYGLTPNTRYADHPTVITMVFETFNTVTAEELHFDGIPYLAHYAGDTGSQAFRMCGDGTRTQEFPCNQDTELITTLDKKTGTPKPEEMAKARQYLAFEEYCHSLVTRTAE